MTIIPFSKSELAPGLYSLKNLPQRESISKISVDTGWWEFDQIYRLYPGQFTIVTGVPGSGKSTFVLNLLINLARRHDMRFMFYGPENEAHLFEKMQRIWGNAPGFERFCEENCWVQSACIEDRNQPAQTLDWVLKQAEAAIHHAEINVLVVDPWNELEWARKKDQTMTDYIADCLKDLKYFSRLYEVAIIVVAHPTKEVGKDGKGRAITLYDIEGSAHWYNKSDNGLIVVRESGTRSTKVISAKVRELGAGKIGVCYFDVDPETEQFTPQHGAVS